MRYLVLSLATLTCGARPPRLISGRVAASRQRPASRRRRPSRAASSTRNPAPSATARTSRAGAGRRSRGRPSRANGDRAAWTNCGARSPGRCHRAIRFVEPAGHRRRHGLHPAAQRRRHRARGADREATSTVSEILAAKPAISAPPVLGQVVEGRYGPGGPRRILTIGEGPFASLMDPAAAGALQGDPQAARRAHAGHRAMLSNPSPTTG